MLVALDARADACPLPAAASGEPYAALATASKPALSWLLGEYMLVHRWTRHAEAVAAGFRYGDSVYGEVLRQGGRFDARKAAAWRRAAALSGEERTRFLRELGAGADPAQLNRAVVDWMLQVCLAPRAWSEVKARDDCRFVFSAGRATEDWKGDLTGAARTILRPVRFQVRGGRCGKWPARPLSEKGDAVECVRSGSGAVELELKTNPGAGTRQTLAPLPTPAATAEPVRETRLTEPATEVISLWRSRDYRQQQLGRGCPSCALYSADVRPSTQDAVILRAETVSSSGTGWERCPAGLRCGVQEFSPPDNPRISGCTDVATCRVWRLAEAEADATDVIQLTFQKPETVCINCPAGVDFETAHQQWAAAARDAGPRCAVVADLPAQSIPAASGAR